MEFRRATIRIASNYIRLGASVVLGVYLYRVLTDTLGDDGIGFVFLLTSTVGIAAIIEEATSWSMIRELGAAHHGGDSATFRTTFHSAGVLSAILTVLVLAVFGVVMACLPLMNISDHLRPAAPWFVVAKAIETATLVIVSPQFNMYLVTERMAAYNFWLTMRRVIVVAAAVSLYWLNSSHDPARGLLIYGWLSCGLIIACTALSVVIIVMKDSRLWPSWSGASKAGMRSMLGISGWNIGLLGSQTLVLPVGTIIMNLAFDLKLNQVFGYATTLSGYARMLASGMTVGLDAVAARISTVDVSSIGSTVSGSGTSMRQLLRTSTLLHSIAVFPAVVGIGMLAHPMLQLWLGSKIQSNPAQTITLAAALTRILLIGFAALLLCDCWTRLLFGAGFVKRYAPLMMIGNALAPVVAVVLLLTLPLGARYTAVAWAFTVIHAALFMATIPQRVASAIGVTYWEVIQPLVKPLAAAIFCSPILWWFMIGVQHWNLLWLGGAALAYGGAYSVLTWFFTLEAMDRLRIVTAAKSRWAVWQAG